MGKKVAIIQSNYIPWKGYFDIINMVDEFIIYDEVQFTKNDWRNRNQIKTPHGKLWISIPVRQTRLHQKISEIVVADSIWRGKHWKTICQYYSKAKCFDVYAPMLEELYMGSEEIYLSKINYHFIRTINSILGIKTRISFDREYELYGSRTERILHLCQKVGASEYFSGPSARDYIEKEVLDKGGIKLTYFDYSGYPEYSQLFPPFDHAVSVIDLILNEGPESPCYMKTFSGLHGCLPDRLDR
jgi:hypothetical protein